MPDAELPSFQPIRDPRTSGKAQDSFDPTIAAAFAAFHRNVNRSRFSSYTAASRQFLGGGRGVFLGLAIIGFAGGLFLAHFSAIAPEQFVSVAPAAPEVIYRRPAATDSRLTPSDRSRSAKEHRPESHGASDARLARWFEAPDSRFHEMRGGSGDEQDLVASVELGGSALPEATANFAAAMRLNAIGFSQSGRGTLDVTTGYEGVELPSVPEPATLPIVACCLAIFVGVPAVRRSLATPQNP